MHMPRDIDSERVQKLTDWLLKLDRQFGLHVSGAYLGNSTILLIEAPRPTWTYLEGLTSFRHVFNVILQTDLFTSRSAVRGDAQRDLERFESRLKSCATSR